MKLSSGFSIRQGQRQNWRCRYIERAAARHLQLQGWDQEKYSETVCLLVGAGGANGEVGEGMAQKGMGTIHICDKDIVEPTNLNRQKFTHRDRWKNKAQRLARNLSKRGFLGSHLIAHPCWFQDLDLDLMVPDIVVCSVDMQVPSTRLEVCRACHERGIPCVFFAVSTDADWGYAFVQEAGEACWACLAKPEFTDSNAMDEQRRCPGVPACCDILKSLAGQVLYAVDTLVMERPRDWNYRAVSLSRSDFGGSQWIERRRGCPVCAVSSRREAIE